MKRKAILISVFVVVVAIIVIVINRGEKPFETLMAKEIETVTMTIQPPNLTVELNKEQIEKLEKILQEITIYEEDDSYGEHDGQAIIFNIKKEDGTELSIMEYNPFVVINGKGYKANGRCLEKISEFAMEIDE